MGENYPNLGKETRHRGPEIRVPNKMKPNKNTKRYILLLLLLISIYLNSN